MSTNINGTMQTYPHLPKLIDSLREMCLLNNVAYWDLSFTDGSNEPKDSSCSAIAMCGILEGIKYMDDTDHLKKIYINATKRMMNTLIDNYLSKDISESNGLLIHQVYSIPHNIGVDEHNIWGDYFYIEALHRMLDPEWELYW